MPSTLEQLSPNRVKLTIEMPFSDLKPALDKAYQQIAAQVNIPGFRKGKVPPQVIDQRFGRGAVLEQAINEALPGAYAEAVTEHSLRPMGQPEVDVTKLEDGDVVEFTAEVDVRPEFDLPDFSTITAQVPNLEVGEEAVNERVEMLRTRFAENIAVERAAAEGDVVTLNLVGTKDGEPLDDASAEGVTYKLGSGGMLDGLDEAVTGMLAEETKTFTSTLLGGAHKDEEAEIEVTVTQVAEQKLPEVDDEFAQMVSQFDTADEMMADLTQAVERQARLEQATQARDKVLEAVLEKTDFELPEALVAEDFQARQQQINSQLAQAGLSLEKYLAESDEEAKDADEFWANIQKRSLDALRAQVILDKMADDDDIQVEQEELTQLIFNKAAQNGSSPEQEMQHMMEHNHTAEWMQEVRRNKALTGMVTAATITDADGGPVNLSSLQADGTVAEDGTDDQQEAAPAKKAAKRATKTAAADAPTGAGAPAKQAAVKKAPAKKAAAKKDAEPTEAADEK